MSDRDRLEQIRRNIEKVQGNWGEIAVSDEAFLLGLVDRLTEERDELRTVLQSCLPYVRFAAANDDPHDGYAYCTALVRKAEKALGAPDVAGEEGQQE